MRDAVKRKCCPKCGGGIIVSFFQQVSHQHPMTKKGRLSKRCTKFVGPSDDGGIAHCRDCSVEWEVDEFWIDDDGYFWDEKYVDDEEESE